VKGTWRKGSFAGDPEGYVEKALETGISFCRGPVLGNLEEGSSTGDFKRWMKGVPWMKCLSLSLSLKRLHGGGLGGSSFTGDPGRYVKKVSGCGHLSMVAPLWPRGTRYVGGLVYRGLMDE
jgi:hypothetical protein